MKRKYFKISAAYYFTILTYISQNLNGDYEKLNENALYIRTEYKFNKLIPVKISEDYITKMIKCCGNVIFNKKEDFYYAKVEECFPILLYFHFSFSKNFEKEKILECMTNLIYNQLNEYLHLDFTSKFIILNENKAFFSLYEKKSFKSLIHFLNTYYKTKKRIIVKKRSTNV